MSKDWTPVKRMAVSSVMLAAGHMGYEDFTEALELREGGTQMKVMFNVTTAERKALVKAVSEIVGERPQYQGVPRCGYDIGCYEIDRQGTLIIPATTDGATLESVLEQLAMKGFTYTEHIDDEPAVEQVPIDIETEEREEAAQEPEAVPATATEPDESQEDNDEPEVATAPDETPDAPQVDATELEATPAPDEAPKSAVPDAPPEEQDGFTIEVPLEGFTDAQLVNLEKLVAGRASLIRKALGVDDLPIMKDGDRLTFPWFHRALDSSEIRAYTHFLAALCEMAKRAKRVAVTDHEVDSEKFAFRGLLLRLGFNGTEYATERKVLLRNLSGSSAFPNSAKAAEHTARWQEKNRVRREQELSNLPTQEGLE